MKRVFVFVALTSFIANANLPVDAITYRIFRYTGVGQAVTLRATAV